MNHHGKLPFQTELAKHAQSSPDLKKMQQNVDQISATEMNTCTNGDTASIAPKVKCTIIPDVNAKLLEIFFPTMTQFSAETENIDLSMDSNASNALILPELRIDIQDVEEMNVFIIKFKKLMVLARPAQRALDPTSCKGTVSSSSTLKAAPRDKFLLLL